MSLRHERLLGRFAGRRPDLWTTLRDVVTDRRIGPVGQVVLVDQPGQHPPGGMALLARRGQVSGEHLVDQRLRRIQLRRRPHRSLPLWRDRALQRLPDRPTMPPVPVGQRPDPQTITSMITTYRLEQLPPQPRPFRPSRSPTTTRRAFGVGPDQTVITDAPACRRWGQMKPSQWGQIRLTGPDR